VCCFVQDNIIFSVIHTKTRVSWWFNTLNIKIKNKCFEIIHITICFFGQDIQFIRHQYPSTDIILLCHTLCAAVKRFKHFKNNQKAR